MREPHIKLNVNFTRRDNILWWKAFLRLLLFSSHLLSCPVPWHSLPNYYESLSLWPFYHLHTYLWDVVGLVLHLLTSPRPFCGCSGSVGCEARFWQVYNILFNTEMRQFHVVIRLLDNLTSPPLILSHCKHRFLLTALCYLCFDSRARNQRR